MDLARSLHPSLRIPGGSLQGKRERVEGERERERERERKREREREREREKVANWDSHKARDKSPAALMPTSNQGGRVFNDISFLYSLFTELKSFVEARTV